MSAQCAATLILAQHGPRGPKEIAEGIFCNNLDCYCGCMDQNDWEGSTKE